MKDSRWILSIPAVRSLYNALRYYPRVRKARKELDEIGIPYVERKGFFKSEFYIDSLTEFQEKMMEDFVQKRFKRDL